MRLDSRKGTEHFNLFCLREVDKIESLTSVKLLNKDTPITLLCHCIILKTDNKLNRMSMLINLLFFPR